MLGCSGRKPSEKAPRSGFSVVAWRPASRSGFGGAPSVHGVGAAMIRERSSDTQQGVISRKVGDCLERLKMSVDYRLLGRFADSLREQEGQRRLWQAACGVTEQGDASSRAVPKRHTSQSESIIREATGTLIAFSRSS